MTGIWIGEVIIWDQGAGEVAPSGLRGFGERDGNPVGLGGDKGSVSHDAVIELPDESQTFTTVNRWQQVWGQ